MVTFYRGHRRTLCCLPGIISLIIMCIGINYFQIITFYVIRRRTCLTGLRLRLNSGPAAHCMCHAVLHMAPKWSSHWTIWAGYVGFTFKYFISTL